MDVVWDGVYDELGVGTKKITSLYNLIQIVDKMSYTK